MIKTLRPYLLLLIVALPLLVLDQWTKLLVDSRFRLHESVPLIDNFLTLTYVRNKGAAFGILSDSAIRIPFFITVSCIALIGILWYLRKVEFSQKLQHWAMALIFAGALGNLIDRIRIGEVIDFIDAHWYQYHWPAFNVADSAITIGVGLLLINLWRDESRRRKDKK
ncbi:MAG: signal peptidase II [Desulfuromonadales bacterium]|nr:signal peptidase II [Desulfuromonadales bacterium]